jgi:hypothetical protein
MSAQTLGVCNRNHERWTFSACVAKFPATKVVGRLRRVENAPHERARGTGEGTCWKQRSMTQDFVNRVGIPLEILLRIVQMSTNSLEKSMSLPPRAVTKHPAHVGRGEDTFSICFCGNRLQGSLGEVAPSFSEQTGDVFGNMDRYFHPGALSEEYMYAPYRPTAQHGSHFTR